MCNGDTTVVDTRKNVDSVFRYRKCRECGYRFSTVEIDEDFYSRLHTKQPSSEDMSNLKKFKKILTEITKKLSDIEG